jgi:hypothetical protein
MHTTPPSSKYIKNLIIHTSFAFDMSLDLKGHVFQAHFENSTDSTKALAPVACPCSVSCTVVGVDSIEDRWDVCSLVLVKKVATLVRRRLLKLSRTLLLGRDDSEG